VVDEVGMEDLVDDIEVALVPHLVPETLEDCLVPFFLLAHQNLSFE
jgi:hypothetical protein